MVEEGIGAAACYVAACYVWRQDSVDPNIKSEVLSWGMAGVQAHGEGMRMGMPGTTSPC